MAKQKNKKEGRQKNEDCCDKTSISWAKTEAKELYWTKYLLNSRARKIEQATTKISKSAEIQAKPTNKKRTEGNHAREAHCSTKNTEPQRHNKSHKYFDKN